jgi:Phasin protein
MQATKNDVSFLQLIDSGLHSPYCALEKARSLVGHAALSTMKIIHVAPATVFHVGQAFRMAFVEKLLGAKSLDTVIQIQSEYAKTSHADFVAQATKMGELYSNLAKACFKPIELTMSNMQGTK